jgi:hypothetical protein
VRRSSLDGLGRRSDLGTALPPPAADDWSGLNDRLRRDYDENVALLAAAKARRELIVLPDEPRRARGAKLEKWLADCAQLTGAQDRAIADLEAKVNPSEDCARARLALARPFYASEVTTALNAVLDPVREQLEMIDDAKRRVPKQLEEKMDTSGAEGAGGASTVRSGRARVPTMRGQMGSKIWSNLRQVARTARRRGVQVSGLWKKIALH